MSNPFTPPDGPFGGRPGFGFGFGPAQRRALHYARRRPGGNFVNTFATTPPTMTAR